MGISSTPNPTHGLADALFSGTRLRLLGLLFGQPSRSFYATELIDLAKSGSGAVQRELANLARSGLVTVKSVGNQKHYQANAASPIFHELCGIVRKTVGLADPLREALDPVAHRIIAAFVYGSVAKGSDTASSDIDLMLLSDELTYGEVFSALETVGNTFGRPVNPAILTRQEFGRRLAAQESFLIRVLQQPKTWIIGSEDALAVWSLSGPGKPLKPEPPDAREFTGLKRSGQARLSDALNESLSLESRFDLAYNAAHAFCLAALRWHGYRASNRYIVFQLLPHTLGLGPETWRVLSKCHDIRNLSEYEGMLNVDTRIVLDLIAACQKVAAQVEALHPLPS